MKTRVTILSVILALALVVGGVSAQEPAGQDALPQLDGSASVFAPQVVCNEFDACNSNYVYYGRQLNAAGWGLVGEHRAATGTTAGLYGLSYSTSTSARAVLGVVVPTNPGGFSAAVRGTNRGTGGNGIGVFGSQDGRGWGVYGTAPNGLGVYGYTSTGWGVFGNHASANGTAAGVYGLTQSDDVNARGVLGIVSPTNAAANSTGVRGENRGTGAGGIGVWGSQNGSGWGVYGSVPSTTAGYAGYFSGRVRVTGFLSKLGGGFEIDHPLDPTNKLLYHSFVESPDMMNVYNGNVALDDSGEAWVELPDYFGALNRDYRYQLTAIGAPGPNLYIAAQVSNNRFKIAGGTEGMTVSWQVTGIRQDPAAESFGYAVEVDKSESERGYYLAPEAYGQPARTSLTNQLQGGLLENVPLLEAPSTVPLLESLAQQGAPAFGVPFEVPLLESQAQQGVPTFEAPLLDEQVPGSELERPFTPLPDLP